MSTKHETEKIRLMDAVGSEEKEGDGEPPIKPRFIQQQITSFTDISVPGPFTQVVSVTQAGLKFDYAYKSPIQGSMDSTRVQTEHDISPSTRQYFRDKLEDYWDKHGEETRNKAFRKELHFLARISQARKFQEMCEFLKAEKVDLCGEAMKGEEYKTNCITYSSNWLKQRVSKYITKLRIQL